MFYINILNKPNNIEESSYENVADCQLYIMNKLLREISTKLRRSYLKK